jgi:hypothetical protein
MRRVEQSTDDNTDPFSEWERYCKSNGVETPLEREVSKGIVSFGTWVKKHSIPVAIASTVLFFGSLRIADSTHRVNAKYSTLEVIQIESVLSARNALIVGVGALASWYAVRKVKG